MADAAVLHLGPRVKALRDAAGLSLRELADPCGGSAPNL
jgi:transcriptional regulator with XRE-family HTH domain